MIILSNQPPNLAATVRMEMFLKECMGARNVLELGCGLADLLKDLRFPGRRLVGMEVWKPYVDSARVSYPDIEFILGDIREADKLVSAKSFDVVVCSDVLEHLEIPEAEKLIAAAEAIAIEKVVYFIPVGIHGQFDDPWIGRISDHTPNPYQLHKSTWYPKMMEDKGYVVWHWTDYHPPQPNKECGAMFCVKNVRDGNVK
jgi:SAM-dependent methyltransferase